MGERKVVQKYIPADFDPAKVPRGKREANGRMEIRMMLPFNCQCLVCGEFMYRGTKFNSKKEDVVGPNGHYLGQKIFRFVMKCMGCNSLFSILTDPQNADYKAERGVSRNFEPYKDGKRQTEEEKKAREEEEKYDAMRALENRTEDSRRQMEMLDALEDLREQKARLNISHVGLSAEALLAARDLKKKGLENDTLDSNQLSQEDEELVRKMFTKRKNDSLLEKASNIGITEDTNNGLDLLSGWGGCGEEKEEEGEGGGEGVEKVSSSSIDESLEGTKPRPSLSQVSQPPIVIKRLREEDVTASVSSSKNQLSASLLSHKTDAPSFAKTSGLQPLISLRPRAVPPVIAIPLNKTTESETKRIKLVDYDDDDDN